MSRAQQQYVCLSVSFSACDGCLVVSTEEEPFTFLGEPWFPVTMLSRQYFDQYVDTIIIIIMMITLFVEHLSKPSLQSALTDKAITGYSEDNVTTENRTERPNKSKTRSW